MQKTIDETNRRRAKQMAYNEENDITPQTIFKSKEQILAQKSILDIKGKSSKAYTGPETTSVAADPVLKYLDRDQLGKLVDETEAKMKKAAKELDFISAAQYRDELNELKKKMKGAV